jgi:hypothetical protein
LALSNNPQTPLGCGSARLTAREHGVFAQRTHSIHCVEPHGSGRLRAGVSPRSGSDRFVLRCGVHLEGRATKISRHSTSRPIGWQGAN